MGIVGKHIAKLTAERDTLSPYEKSFVVSSDSNMIAISPKKINTNFTINENIYLDLSIICHRCERSEVNLHFDLATDSHLRCCIVAEQCHDLHVKISTVMHGDGANSDVRNFFYGKASDRQIFTVSQQHTSPRSQSSVVSKVLLDDVARSRFHGTITIDKQASNCSADQQNNNILLSQVAQAWATPDLNIMNKDVKCSHGATIGPIDDDVVFYMMSRGLDITSCKDMIAEGNFLSITS